MVVFEFPPRESFNYACKYTMGTTVCTIHVSGSHLSVWCTLNEMLNHITCTCNFCLHEILNIFLMSSLICKLVDDVSKRSSICSSYISRNDTVSSCASQSNMTRFMHDSQRPLSPLTHRITASLMHPIY